MNFFLNQAIDQLVECLTEDGARKVLALRASDALQKRVDTLADKANLGTLSNDERLEYDRYLAMYHLVTRVQARTRQRLRT